MSSATVGRLRTLSRVAEQGNVLTANQHDISRLVQVSLCVELPDHYHIGRARLITQPLPAEPAYLILQMTVPGLESEVTLHVRWLGGLQKVLIKFFGIRIDKHLGKCHRGSTHQLRRHSSFSLSHDRVVDNRPQKPQQITAN